MGIGWGGDGMGWEMTWMPCRLRAAALSVTPTVFDIAMLRTRREIVWWPSLLPAPAW